MNALQRAAAPILRKLRINPPQYFLLLDLFAKLSDRQEFEAGNARISVKITVGMFAVFSGLINLIVAFGPKPPLHWYIFGNFLFTTFLLMMVLTMEAINTFLNPVEASVLAHQPIRDFSYFAAKLTYLAMVVGWVAFPINIVPALAGLNLVGTRWFYPVTYMISVYLLGLFIALIACGALGMLFRIMPAGRVRNGVLWVQIVFFMSMSAGNLVLGAFRAVGRGINIQIATSRALPLNWFVAFAALDSADVRMLLTWSAILSLIGCAIFIAFGIQALSEGYLTRVHTLLHTGPTPRPGRTAVLGRVIRAVTGKPSGRAAFSFVYGMAKTDWQFRRVAYPMLLQVLVVPLIAFARTGLGRSPFQPGPPTGAQVLPHIGGFMGFVFCFALGSSNQYRAAWIFLTFPFDGIRSFVRGIHWALWILICAPTIVGAPFFIWKWGIADAALFTVYSIAIGSFYLSIELFLIDGLPFANPPESMKGSMTAPLMIAALIGAGILVGLQWLFIFQSRFVTLGAILVFIGAAYVIAQVSMRYLQVNVFHTLHRIASGSTAMFKEIG
jgi:hypothetical protein